MRREVQFVDVGLPLPTALDHQQALTLKRLEVRAHAAVGDAEVCGQALLPGEAIVVLPGVREQHGESHFVAAAELLRFEDEIWNLREALLRRGVRAAKDNIALFEDVADVPVG